jgi:hypothetical protein
MMTDLINAPPRLSDLRGDDLRRALFERHERQKQEWLQARQSMSFPQRLASLIVGSWIREGSQQVRTFLQSQESSK